MERLSTVPQEFVFIPKKLDLIRQMIWTLQRKKTFGTCILDMTGQNKGLMICWRDMKEEKPVKSLRQCIRFLIPAILVSSIRRQVLLKIGFSNLHKMSLSRIVHPIGPCEWKEAWKGSSMWVPWTHGSRDALQEILLVLVTVLN